MPDLINQTLLNRYHVIESLGRGGNAEVYKVWDSHRSSFLALKLLHADLALDRVFLRRFKREAQTLARLQHPNIVRFYDLEQDGRLVFMLMDYVEGESLKHKIFDANGPMPSNQIMEIIRPLCQALQYAHNEGFVHSDVKPGNILIDKTGRVMLTDFGIARMTETATVTMIGAGTPAYMSPEQARGESPTPQTDIYALGVILFEMLTGERPFTGENAKTTGGTSEKVRWEQMNLPVPSPRKFNQNISPELEAVVLKCLEKKPENRYQDINALTLAIQIAMKDNLLGSIAVAKEPSIAPQSRKKYEHSRLSPRKERVKKSRSAITQTEQIDKMIQYVAVGIILSIVVVFAWMILSKGTKANAPGANVASVIDQATCKIFDSIPAAAQYSAPPSSKIDAAKKYLATFNMAKGGEFVVQLYPDKAPITVNSFVFLACKGFFNGSTFHRVLDGFMAQGGDPSGTGTGGPGYQFPNEKNDLAFDKPGVVAMANAGPNTNGSQFFIMFGPYGLSENDYTIFGQVTSGMDVVNGITRRDPDQNPTFTGDVIQSIMISN